METIPLYKSHFSIGKSILMLEKPKGEHNENSVSIFDLVEKSGKDYLTLVEDNMTGFLEAVTNCEKKKIKLCFGLRLEFTKDILNQDEKSLKSRSKYIIFAKNNEGYKNLINIWSLAAKEGFYYNSTIDFKNLKLLWSENLIFAVPFYDS